MATYTSPQDGSAAHATLASGSATINFQLFEVGEYNAGVGTSRTILNPAWLSDGSVPNTATLVSVKLYAKISNDYSGNARAFRGFRLKRNVNIAQCTWNIYATGFNWQTSGGFGANDCEQTDICSVAMSASETVGTWKEFVFDPAAVQEMLVGTWSAKGFLIKADTEADDRYDFSPYNASPTGNRPYWVVEYTTTSIKSVNGVAHASVKKIEGVAIGSVKKTGGIA